jgi:hypothetical protein
MKEGAGEAHHVDNFTPVNVTYANQGIDSSQDSVGQAAAQSSEEIRESTAMHFLQALAILALWLAVAISCCVYVSLEHRFSAPHTHMDVPAPMARVALIKRTPRCEGLHLPPDDHHIPNGDKIDACV